MNLETRTITSGHYIQAILKRVYKEINQKCEITGKIPLDDIIYTQENVEIEEYYAFFVGSGNGYNRNFF